MTASKFTPGPWRFVNGRQIRSERDQIAQVWMMRNGEGIANAHLIAAAPELYEALVLLMAEVDFSGNGNAKDFGWPRATEAARVALAKARGEE